MVVDNSSNKFTDRYIVYSLRKGIEYFCCICHFRKKMVASNGAPVVVFLLLCSGEAVASDFHIGDYN